MIIPPQVMNITATETANVAGETANTGLKTGLVTKVAIQNGLLKGVFKVIFKQSMATVMGAIGFLQLVVFFPLIKVKYPANARILTD